MTSTPASRTLPFATRAPGKCILFGEHAIVYGRPELLLAIDLYTQIGFSASPRLELNHDAEALGTNPYLRAALDRFPLSYPISLRATTRLPKASGLGSSAAFTAALTQGLVALSGDVALPVLAQAAFDVERTAQGVGSPGDTTASIAGGYVSINGGSGPELWTVAADNRSWTARSVPDPRWVWVVGFSGVPRNTGLTVRAVGERLSRPDGPRLLDALTEVAEQGIAAVGHEDRYAVGPLLNRNQEILRELGVSHPRLEAMIDSVRPVAEGAKLTGAGAGGSIVVLPKIGQELMAARRVARAGGVSFVVRPAATGVVFVE